jgi:peptidyl-prolyl cis-trans isomerase SurA
MYKFNLFFATLITFVVLNVPAPAHSSVLLDRVVAVVNKEVITWSELYEMMEYEATDQVKALKQEDRLKVFKNNEALFLDRLIDIRLQIQDARRLGFEVTPDELTQAIESIKKKYSLTDDLFKESLKKEGLTIEDYKKRLSEQILVSHFVNQQIKNKVIVSEEDVKKYIDLSKQSLNDGESFKLRMIFFAKPKDDADRKTNEDKASLVIQRLKAGEDFSLLAKEYSEDPSAKNGGELGFIKQSQTAKEFLAALSKMNIGDFSNPFWTEKGLQIIKLDEKTAVKSIDSIREDAKNQVAEVQFQEKYKSWIKSLREKAHIEIRL